MNTVERGAAIVAILAAVFTAGAAWNSLSNRIDKVDDKIGAIQKTLGSTPCTAILDRQLAAIDKSRADVRKALDALSDQYGCANGQGGEVMAATNTVAVARDTGQLGTQLNAVDMQLNKNR
jgi:hypothetical protein